MVELLYMQRSPAGHFGYAIVQILSWLIFIVGIYGIGLHLVHIRSFFSGGIHQTISLVIYILLIFFSLKLRQGKIIAWWIILVLAAGVLLLNVFDYRPIMENWQAIAIFGSILVSLLLSKPYFTVRSDPASWRTGLTFLAISLAVALAYGTFGFYTLDRRDFGQDFSLSSAFQETFKEYFIDDSNLVPHTRTAHIFLESLNVVGATTLTLVFLSLFRPLRFALGQTETERQMAEAITAKYGTSTEDFFKLWPHDKHFYFNSQQTAFITFRVVRGVALALGDPTGEPRDSWFLIQEFATYARTNGWAPGFVHCSDQFLDAYQKSDLQPLKIGQEAVINLSDFVAETARDKHFRYVRNKFTKIGYTFEFLVPPFNAELMQTLGSISNEWLGDGARKERGFGLGYFNEEYLEQCPLAVVQDKDGRSVAFANLIPSYVKDESSIDLMRYSNSAEPGVMNFLLLNLLEQLHSQGYKKFNLGLAPLASLEASLTSPLPDQLLSALKNYGNRYFAFQGLEHFKRKFDPSWQDRYIYYSGGTGGVLKMTIALNTAMKVKT